MGTVPFSRADLLTAVAYEMAHMLGHEQGILGRTFASPDDDDENWSWL